MFPESFPKGSYRFLYVPFIIIQFVTPVPLDYSTSVCDVIPVLKGHQEVLYDVA